MDATAPAMSGHAIIPLMRSLGFDAAAQLALAQGKSYGASKDFSRRTRNRATDGQEDAAIQKQPHLSSRNRSYPPHLLKNSWLLDGAVEAIREIARSRVDKLEQIRRRGVRADK